MHNHIPSDLIERFQKGEVIVVTGTGVTAATVPAEQRGIASWVGLIRHGLEYCKTVTGSNEKKLEAFLEDLAKDAPELGDLFDAANYASRVLREAKPPKYVAWLDEAVGQLTANNTELIKAIGALDCPILTLNYDSLIHTTLKRERAVWTQGDLVQAITRKEFNRVLHLHGHYAEASSVILSEGDYGRISADATIQAILAAVALQKTLLFVGCGETLNDPNWQPMLRKLEGIFAAQASNSLFRHYLLVREGEEGKYAGINSQVVVTPYGAKYDDLPGFLREFASKKLGASLPNPTVSKALTWDAALERYKLWANEEHGKIKNYLMHKHMSFDGLFTNVQVMDKPEAMRFFTREAFERQDLLDSFGRDRNQKPSDAMQVVNANKRVYVLGKPGAGKTTFLKHLLRHTLKHQPEAVPFFVTLKEWSESVLDFEQYLIHQLERGAVGFNQSEAFLKSILADGHAVVLLDGLDEVNLEDGQRDEIVKQIKTFCQNHRKNRFVLTCRVAANEYNFEHFQYVQIADFSEEQIETFVQNWFGEKPELGSIFLQNLKGPRSRGFLDLAGVPLLLTLLCVAFEETQEFPVRKSSLYVQALDALLRQWDMTRSIKRSQHIYKGLYLERKHELFAKLAFENFVEGRIFFETDPLARQIEAFLQRIPTNERQGAPAPTQSVGRDVLQAIEEQHGVLIPRARDVHSMWLVMSVHMPPEKTW
jgi:energy-coupling factor transporter ATP-binding protein EcfA2